MMEDLRSFFALTCRSHIERANFAFLFNAFQSNLAVDERASCKT
jgi:hypothetical protein